METIEGACPKCKRQFSIELSDGPLLTMFTACDHCGYEKRVSAFTKELERQKLAPIEEQKKREKLAVQAERVAVKKVAQDARTAVKQENEQFAQELAAQRNKADLTRLNTGVGCPACGSLRNRSVRRWRGSVTAAVGVFLMVIGLIFCLFIVGICIGLPVGGLGLVLLIIGGSQTETKLHCFKCGLER